jgi:hypothetical protein
MRGTSSRQAIILCSSHQFPMFLVRTDSRALQPPSISQWSWVHNGILGRNCICGLGTLRRNVGTSMVRTLSPLSDCVYILMGFWLEAFWAECTYGSWGGDLLRGGWLGAREQCCRRQSIGLLHLGLINCLIDELGYYLFMSYFAYSWSLPMLSTTCLRVPISLMAWRAHVLHSWYDSFICDWRLPIALS